MGSAARILEPAFAGDSLVTEATDIQADLKLDYKSNIERYPLYQQYLRTHRPPLLAMWGKNDTFFIPPGADAFKRDVPDADVRFVDAGHFALETNVDDYAEAIMNMTFDA